MATAGTGQANEWRLAAPHFSINTNVESSVNCIKFDPHEELFWTGSAAGKVASFLPTNHFSRYSAFVVSKVSGVNSLEPTENALFALTDTSLRVTSKQGIPIGKYTSQSMTRMMAMCRMPGTSTFVMGGFQEKLIHYDFVKEKEIRTTDLKEGEHSIIIRYNGTNTFTADSKGNVIVKSPKNFETLQVIDCHQDRILDFDVQGSKLISCGVTMNRQQNMDRFVKVYDLRMHKALTPCTSQLIPQFVRFIPSYCERICIMAQSMNLIDPGNNWGSHPASIRMFDLASNGNHVEFGVETSIVTAFDYSSSKNFAAIGSHVGVICAYADRDQPIVNDSSKETIFAAPPAQPPISFAIDDTTQTFGSIPFPFSQGPLVSDWPSELTQIVHRRRKPPSDLTNVKSIHYATQIRNPRINSKLKQHNIVPYFLEHIEPVIEVHDVQKIVEQSEHRMVKTRVSKLYKKRPPPVNHVPSRRGNSSDETPETYTWNTIRHITMQSTHAMNLVANTVVQVVYSLSPLRSIVMRHICTNDTCITCELHFLFNAFSSKIGQSDGIITTNLALALTRNGVSLKTGGVLHAINEVIKTILDDVAEKDINASVSTKFNRHLCCIRCRGLQTVEAYSDHLLSLNYGSLHQTSLCQLIEKSLHLGPETGEKECEDCKQMSRMECKRKVRELSPVLLISTNTSSEDYVDFWRQQLSTHEVRPDAQTNSFGSVPESPSEKKRCRYGEDCRNKKTCKFAHGHIDWSSEQSKLLEHVDSSQWSHYIPSRIAAQVCEGIVRISDISDIPGYDEPTAIIYELDAMIHVIGNGEHDVKWTHPVTLLRESPVASTAWTLINEQLVSRLHDHEARYVDGRWKLPALLVYRQKGDEILFSEKTFSDDLFFSDDNLAMNGTESLAIKSMEDLPKAGELVGLDAEFIKIKTDMLEFDGRSVQVRAVGRASCVDATGQKVIFDDYVRLTDDMKVVDYLTRYSGIVESDLLPASSDKYLTTHKRLLLRMHVLIQRGVIFVGHALHNDFTVINVHVPEPQIIDTVVLLRLEAQRMLSLQFLVKEMLGEIIQTAEHDSVVDAQYALKMYRKYLELRDQGILSSEMRRIYTILPSCNSPSQTSSPLIVSTLRKTPDDPADAAPQTI
ncbi:hypothetical protein GCK72_009945 [Caenorhabditis remanei]|uniref:USP domain-containing protein n=1 Tax=Caenorhabditis remanei TaxID=31234 RepID=A0A6A5H3W5_CAERE|nr:hypothetical protein GCK72_009945 [Caenorhabditis remanei]KAF1761689.1 hypothetical protein GCK72_009945 [Caenorhabditis remanei]